MITFTLEKTEYAIEEIGGLLEEVRTVKRMTLAEIGRKANISRQYVDLIEKGAINPNVNRVVSVFRVLGYKATPVMRERLTVGSDTAYEVVYLIEPEPKE